jgi:hypothetical protein
MLAPSPKLSDCGGRCSPCGKVAGAQVVGARAVTLGAVRWSAWLGPFALLSADRLDVDKISLMPIALVPALFISPVRGAHFGLAN